MPRSDTASPLNEQFSLEAIISGLALDLQALRDGKITIEHAKASAELGKQIFNGVRLVINARKTLEQGARQITAKKDTETPTR